MTAFVPGRSSTAECCLGAGKPSRCLCFCWAAYLSCRYVLQCPWGPSKASTGLRGLWGLGVCWALWAGTYEQLCWVSLKVRVDNTLPRDTLCAQQNRVWKKNQCFMQAHAYLDLFPEYMIFPVMPRKRHHNGKARWSTNQSQHPSCSVWNCIGNDSNRGN